MVADPALALWLGLLGPCIGSFLAAFAERFCSGESYTTPSRCRHCDTRLTWMDMVPLASWLVLGGRCRHCGVDIGRGLLIAELAGGFLAATAVLAGDAAGQEVAGAVWLWCLMGLFLTDRSCLRLPDPLTLALLCAGLYLGAQGSVTGLITASATAVTGSLALWLLARIYRLKRGREGLGLGDVKMIAGIAAAVGPVALPWVTLLSALGSIVLASRHNGRMLRFDTAARLPFGSALAVTGAIVWLVGRL